MGSPSPLAAVSNLRPDITGMFEEFSLEMNAQKLIALEVFPVFEVGLQAGPFGKITLESLMKAVDTTRTSGGAYNESDFEFTTDSYATKEHGIAVPVDQRNAKIYANYFDAEMVAARLARHKVMLNLESRVAALVYDTGVFTPTAITNEWDDHTNATPLDDVEAAVLRLYAKGIVANALVLNWKQFRNLRHCDQVINRITASGAGSPAKPTDITKQMLATVFDLEKIIVGGSQYNSAIEGQTASLSPVWSDEYAMVTRVASGGIEDPGLGRTFHWGEDGSQIGGLMESYYWEEVRGDKVRCRMETHEKVIYSEAGELLSNVITI
jgi:hypothetical protein